MTTRPRPVPETRDSARFSLRRLLPLAAVVAATGVVIGLGLHRHLSFETLVRHHAVIHDFIVANLPAAVAVYIAIYVTATALSIPGALFLTLAGGMLLGGLVGGLATLVGATGGATLIFLLARSAFGEHLARRAGSLVEKLARGFRANAFHYLLFLRLVPVFPFWLVNLVPALAGVPLGTFVAATAIGIVPATFAFAFVGAGLDSVIRAQGTLYHACVASGRTDCRVDFDLKTVMTPELVGGLAALGVVALVPVVVKRLRARSTAADSS